MLYTAVNDVTLPYTVKLYTAVNVTLPYTAMLYTAVNDVTLPYTVML